MTHLLRGWHSLSLLLCLLCVSASNTWAQSRPAVAAPSSPTPATPTTAQPLSHDAQRAYEGARDKLVQIRTLLRNSDTQASVGSGFLYRAAA